MDRFGLSVLVFVLAMSLLVPLVSAAVDVTITVVDKDNEPIEDVNVELRNSTDSVCNGTTDSDGEVSCDNMDTDVDYRILATHDDYSSIDDDKTLDNFDNDWDQVGVVMRPKTFDLTIHVCAGGSGTSCGSGSEDIDNAEVSIESLDEVLTASDFGNDYGVIVFPAEKSQYEAFEVDSDESPQDTDSSGEAVIGSLEFNTAYKITGKASGYTSTFIEYEFPNEADDQDVDLKLVEPGTATVTVVTRDKESDDLVEGVNVIAENTETGKKVTQETNSKGAATLTLPTPGCYDITATKAGYTGDQVTDQCFENDDSIPSLPLFLTSENKPPVANAGPDKYIIIGDRVTLDASASSDPDEDELTYEWEDSLDVAIPNGAQPSITFDTAGEHKITLTVSDGTETDTDEVVVYVERRENCGDNICSLSENATQTCPKDCPVCLDRLCGAGENNPATGTIYCPVDCNITAAIKLLNTTELIPGNSTIISVVDPSTGQPIVGASVQVVVPNGTILRPQVLMGRASVAFPEAGKYTVSVSADKYVSASKVIEVRAVGGLGWLLWAVIIAVIVLGILYGIRMYNMRRKAHGYRAKNFRRGKPTLKSV